MLVLTKRLLLVKMKKIKVISLIAFVLTVLLYLLPSQDIHTQGVIESGPSVALPNDKVHIFYDASYRNEKTDQAFLNWYKRGSEGVLDTVYYPELGLYSSKDPTVVDLHMQQIQSTGAGVVVVYWWPPDHEKSPPMSLILKYAQKYDLKVTIHIQNYENRTLRSVMKDVISVLKIYGDHPAFYKLKVPSKTRALPLIYVYESLEIKPSAWSIVLGSNSNYSIRNTKYDALFIGLIIEEIDRYLVANSEFDGFYTLHSHFNHTYATTWYYWPYIQDFSRDRNLIFIPTVSPGYDYRMSKKNVDPLLVPPLTGRRYGSFYANAWSRAVISRSRFVAINSFNGWLAGSQIEPAQSFDVIYKKLKINYEDYSPGTSNEYLQLTRKWVIEFTNRSLYRSP